MSSRGRGGEVLEKKKTDFPAVTKEGRYERRGKTDGRVVLEGEKNK